MKKEGEKNYWLGWLHYEQQRWSFAIRYSRLRCVAGGCVFFVLYSVMMSWICSLYFVFVCAHQSESLNSHISILLYHVYLYYIRFVILLFGFARWKNKEEKRRKTMKTFFFSTDCTTLWPRKYGSNFATKYI